MSHLLQLPKQASSLHHRLATAMTTQKLESIGIQIAANQIAYRSLYFMYMSVIYGTACATA